MPSSAIEEQTIMFVGKMFAVEHKARLQRYILSQFVAIYPSAGSI